MFSRFQLRGRKKRVPVRCRKRRATSQVKVGEEEPLLGSAKQWNAHIVVTTQIPASSWPKHISECSDTAKDITLALEAKKASYKVFDKTKISLCNLHKDSSEGAVYLFASTLAQPIHFPKYNKNQILSAIDVLDALQEPADPEAVLNELLIEANATVRKGYFAFVCSHANHDERCGKCGPQIYSELTKIVELLSFESDSMPPLAVGQMSHVGGHKFAGNLLVYPPGDLYGYVSEENVLDIVKHHIFQRSVKEGNWRGRMGVAAERLQNILEQQQKL